MKGLILLGKNSKEKIWSLLKTVKICYLCGGLFKNRKIVTLDHMIPASKKIELAALGIPTHANLSPTHSVCNNIKANGSILVAVKKITALKSEMGNEHFVAYVNNKSCF